MLRSEKITVFCNKSIEFVHPRDRGITATIRDHQFEVAPEWILSTALFRTLQEEGSIKIIKNSIDVKSAEIKGKIVKDELDKLEKDEELKAYMSKIQKAKEEKAEKAIVEDSGDDEEKEHIFVTTDTEEEGSIESEEATAELIEAEEDAEEELDFDNFTAKQLYMFCVNNGIEVEEKKSRKYYLEKIDGLKEE